MKHNTQIKKFKANYLMGPKNIAVRLDLCLSQRKLEGSLYLDSFWI